MNSFQNVETFLISNGAYNGASLGNLYYQSESEKQLLGVIENGNIIQNQCFIENQSSGLSIEPRHRGQDSQWPFQWEKNWQQMQSVNLLSDLFLELTELSGKIFQLVQKEGLNQQINIMMQLQSMWGSLLNFQTQRALSSETEMNNSKLSNKELQSTIQLIQKVKAVASNISLQSEAWKLGALQEIQFSANQQQLRMTPQVKICREEGYKNDIFDQLKKELQEGYLAEHEGSYSNAEAWMGSMSPPWICEEDEVIKEQNMKCLPRVMSNELSASNFQLNCLDMMMIEPYQSPEVRSSQKDAKIVDIAPAKGIFNEKNTPFTSFQEESTSGQQKNSFQTFMYNKDEGYEPSAKEDYGQAQNNASQKYLSEIEDKKLEQGQQDQMIKVPNKAFKQELQAFQASTRNILPPLSLPKGKNVRFKTKKIKLPKAKSHQKTNVSVVQSKFRKKNYQLETISTGFSSQLPLKKQTKKISKKHKSKQVQKVQFKLQPQKIEIANHNSNRCWHRPSNEANNCSSQQKSKFSQREETPENQVKHEPDPCFQMIDTSQTNNCKFCHHALALSNKAPTCGHPDQAAFFQGWCLNCYIQYCKKKANEHTGNNKWKIESIYIPQQEKC